jgi:NAD(P)-dependent dehydrogenase (short-subunit alcohol dehydrogenase family)
MAVVSRGALRWSPARGGTLGGAVARGFGREGASVLVGYRRSQSAAESAAAEIVAAGGVAHAHELDVTDQASVDRFVGQADALYGRVDVLVNTAGRRDEADTVRFEHMSVDAAAALFAVDVLGAMRMRHSVIPHMRPHGHGSIINFSSTYGNGVNPENAINWVPVTYCAAKGAIRGLTASLARDIAPEIRVNALAPARSRGTGNRSGASPPITSRRQRR